MKKSAIVGAVLAVVLVVGVFAYVLAKQGEPAQTTESQETRQPTATGPTESGDSEAVQSDVDAAPTIVFTDDGFSQNEYTFASGMQVRVENRSSMSLQFSSDEHPTHRDHPELNMRVLAAGESDTFMPPGKGEYSFHDHINDQYTATLVIE